MGAAKDALIRYQELRYGPIDDDRLVCEECFEDDGIREFIRENANRKGCDFCEEQSARDSVSVEINSVIEFIAECLRREYGSPEDMLMWDSEDGSYMMANEIQSTDELITENIECRHEEVFNLVVSAFDETADWVSTTVLIESHGERMTSLWTQFADSVKYEKRFFFPRASKDSVKRIGILGPREPADILTATLKAAKEIGLFRELESGKSLYRARKFNISEVPLRFGISNMGVPAREISKRHAHRMSPAGIPIFYGAYEPGTAKAEIEYATGDVIVVGEFKVNRKLNVLDLTSIPATPSIFKESSRDKRDAILFLNKFSDLINQDVDRSGDEHVDYIPSQIFTEFVRYRVKYLNKPVDGIVFHSNKNFGGKNIALFCDNSGMSDIEGLASNCFLKFRGVLHP